MKIVLKTSYKALTPFETVDLPDFVVLTGKNGSGKTQLLELLNFKDPNLGNGKPKKSIPSEIDGLHIEGCQIQKIRMTSFGNTGMGSVGGAGRNLLEHKRGQLVSHLVKLKANARSVHVEHPHDYYLLKKVASFYEKNVQDLTEEEIRSHRFEADDFVELKDIFTYDIAALVASYFEFFWDNLCCMTAANEFDKDIRYLSREEFYSKYPNPFTEINTILETGGIDYRLKEITLEDYRLMSGYIPEFRSLDGSIVVDPSNFSTGEKILLSLAFSILNSSRYEESVLPDLLLLDEIDAALHPSMIRSLLDILLKYLVKGKKIKVILTTHNPTTVALAPSESIFVLKKRFESTEGGRFIKADKKEAISELLDGVNAIDIMPEHRRWVFVESRIDSYFYESVYKSILKTFSPDIYVNFIPSGVEDGNCELVRATVNKLRQAGNDRIFGIIDWDKKNEESDAGLIVNGMNEYYSLENVVLNCFHLALYLINEQQKTFDDFGVRSDEHWAKKKDSLTQEEVRTIVSSVESEITEVSSKDANSCQFDKTNLSVTIIELQNGMKVDFKNHILHMKGHALVDELKKAYPSLNRYQERDLLGEVIKKVIIHSSEFLPKSVVRSINKIFV